MSLQHYLPKDKHTKWSVIKKTSSNWREIISCSGIWRQIKVSKFRNPVSDEKVRPSVCPSVRPFVRSFSPNSAIYWRLQQWIWRHISEFVRGLSEVLLWSHWLTDIFVLDWYQIRSSARMSRLPQYVPAVAVFTTPSNLFQVKFISYTIYHLFRHVQGGGEGWIYGPNFSCGH